MATNNILELNGNESLNELIDKLNSNFDQLASLNGGPQGPVGKQGVPGLPGLQGPQGIQGEKGEDGTKIEGVDKDAEWPDTYEQGKIYIGVNGDGSVVLRQRDDSEIGYSESVLLNKSAIDTAGFFEKNSDVSDTHIYASKQITDSPRLVFGSGDGYEQIDNQIWGESNFTPYEKSKLILNSSGNKEIFEGKTIEVDGNNVSVSTTSSIYLQNENSYAGASIGVASYGDKTMVDILGIDDSKADLYVDGRVMSVNGFTVEPNNGDTKMFGAKSGSLGGSCSYIYGIAKNTDNSLLCGAKFVTDGSVDFVSGASKNMNFSSGENFLFANSSNNNAEFPIFGIKRADKENDGIIFKYEGKNNLMFEEKNATGWTTSYDYKAVTQTGVKGQYKITFIDGAGNSDVNDSFYVSFSKIIGSKQSNESGGLFVDSNRLSYYGGDGMQIKLNKEPYTHSIKDDSHDEMINVNYLNLIEFAIDIDSNAQDSDYFYKDSYSARKKIGSINFDTGSNLNITADQYKLKLYDVSVTEPISDKVRKKVDLLDVAHRFDSGDVVASNVDNYKSVIDNAWFTNYDIVSNLDSSKKDAILKNFQGIGLYLWRGQEAGGPIYTSDEYLGNNNFSDKSYSPMYYDEDTSTWITIRKNNETNAIKLGEIPYNEARYILGIKSTVKSIGHGYCKLEMQNSDYKLAYVSREKGSKCIVLKLSNNVSDAIETSIGIKASACGAMYSPDGKMCLARLITLTTRRVSRLYSEYYVLIYFPEHTETFVTYEEVIVEGLPTIIPILHYNYSIPRWAWFEFDIVRN